MRLLDIIKEVLHVNRMHYEKLKDQRKMRYQQELRHADIFNHVHQSNRIVFVLSTGRCGTQFLTKVLEKDRLMHVEHDPQVELLFWSKKAYLDLNQEQNKAVFDGARYEMIRNTILAGKTYVETNNRVTFFASEIASLYPNARFIHLVRNPEKFVKSGLGRGWYKDDYHYINEGVLEPREKGEAWQQLSRVGKIAWLWNETNQFIEDFKQTIEQDRCITVQSEKLFSDPDEVLRIAQFVGSSKLDRNFIAQLQKRPVNRGKKTTVSSFSEDEQQEFNSQVSLRKY